MLRIFWQIGVLALSFFVGYEPNITRPGCSWRLKIDDLAPLTMSPWWICSFDDVTSFSIQVTQYKKSAESKQAQGRRRWIIFSILLSSLENIISSIDQNPRSRKFSQYRKVSSIELGSLRAPKISLRKKFSSNKFLEKRSYLRSKYRIDIVSYRYRIVLYREKKNKHRIDIV